MIKRLATIIAVLTTISILSLTHTSTASAAGMGLRAGYGADPDQFVAGGQLVLGKTLRLFRFTPGVDIGFGDDVTTYTGNVEWRLIELPLPKSRISLYAAGGPTFTLWDLTNNGSELEVGATAAGGVILPISSRLAYTGEVRIGFGDVPEVRFLVGILFGG